METKKESPRVSPVGPAPLPPKKVEEMYVVFAEADVKSSWATLEDARYIAKEAVQHLSQPMLIFQLVGKEHKR